MTLNVFCVMKITDKFRLSLRLVSFQSFSCIFFSSNFSISNPHQHIHAMCKYIYAHNQANNYVRVKISLAPLSQIYFVTTNNVV